jgi:hypothetical protein
VKVSSGFTPGVKLSSGFTPGVLSSSAQLFPIRLTNSMELSTT